MERVSMTIEQIREESTAYYMNDCDNTMGIMALVDVENMGFCKDDVTRWYHFTNANGEPAVYYKY